MTRLTYPVHSFVQIENEQEFSPPYHSTDTTVDFWTATNAGSGADAWSRGPHFHPVDARKV